MLGAEGTREGWHRGAAALPGRSARRVPVAGDPAGAGRVRAPRSDRAGLAPRTVP